MSKVDELRTKYPSVTNTTFKKFVEGDKTKTKKYLPFMLKTWVNRNNHITSIHLVELVNMFDELLPYIENKDIYSKEYEDLSVFVNTINKAIDDKEENSFIKEEHITVLYENDNFILIHPKTHRGSCKYGANTKWCTASKKDEPTFNRYKKDGFLMYVLSKKKDKSERFEKIAYHSKKRNDPLFDIVETFDTTDKMVDSAQLVEGGWDVHDIFQISTIFRANFSNWKRTETAKDYINKSVDYINNINFETLTQSIKIVENSENIDYINNLRENINNFIKKIPINI